MAITTSINQYLASTVSAILELPMDLIFHILSTFPIKTLLQFKTVCKTWHRLIENPIFIKIHHTKWKLNPIPLTSVLVTAYDSEKGLYSTGLQFENNFFNLNISFEYNPRVLGICDGLVCLDIGNSEIIICNPTIGRVRFIPKFNIPIMGRFDIVFSGFGFHNNGYKLFRIVYSPCGGPKKKIIRAEVYTMCTDNWREIKVITKVFNSHVLLMYHGAFNATPVAINEVFYWEACGLIVACVLYFDMNAYVFGEIECPESLGQDHVPWKLVNLKGKLALVICSKYHLFEIWMLNENRKSWTMKFKGQYSSFSALNIRCVGCDREGELVIQYSLPNGEIKLFSYDPEIPEIVYLLFSGLKVGFDVYLYTESLLLV